MLKTIHYRTLFIGLLLAAVGFGSTLGVSCDGTTPFEPPEGSALLLQANLDKLPPENVQAKTVLPPALGPAGAIFGLLLEEDLQAFFLGDVDETNDELTVTGVAFFDADGNFILQQDIEQDRTRLTFETGDAIEIDFTGPTPRFVMTLNGTTPPSVIVLDVDENNVATIDESATRLEEEPNPNFNDGTARIRLSDMPPNRLHPAKAQAYANLTCADVGNAFLLAVSLTCQLATLAGDLPSQAVNLLCIAALNSVTIARMDVEPGSNAFRAFSALRVSVGVACEGLKAASGLAAVASRANPLGLGCTVFRLINDSQAILSGQSLATLMCNFFAGDQDLGGLLVDISSVDMQLLDTGVDDGDEISIKRNGLEVFSGVVTTGGDTISINLDRGLNHFEFIALNEGTLPPNTAQVTVLGLGTDNLGDAVFTLSTGQVATMDIVRR